MDDFLKGISGAVVGALTTALGFVIGLDRHIDRKIEAKMQPMLADMNSVKRSDEKIHKRIDEIWSVLSDLQGNDRVAEERLRSIDSNLEWIRKRLTNE